jgi:hypothetical protein
VVMRTQLKQQQSHRRMNTLQERASPFSPHSAAVGRAPRWYHD